MRIRRMAADVEPELIQALILIGLWHVKGLLEEEARQIAGERNKRSGIPRYDNEVSKGSSVYLLDQKLPIMVPRVRNQRESKEVEP